MEDTGLPVIIRDTLVRKQQQKLLCVKDMLKDKDNPPPTGSRHDSSSPVAFLLSPLIIREGT